MSPSAQKYDIVIIGAGPVGLLLSVCLSRWGYRIRHIDNRPVPTATGRADGIQPRSLEILRNLGLKRKIMAYHPARVFEVAFWDPAPGGKIVRTGTWASCPSFLDARYPFTALLHQGLIERVFIEDIEKHGTKVDRPWTIHAFENNGKDPDYPVEVALKSLDSNVIETVNAKYLFSGEGAKSFVRKKLGVRITHKDPIAHVWGVMDGVVRTNFPDIKMKCTIHSDHGSIMVIPREDKMVRLYIQIASSADPDFNPRKTATAEQAQTAAIKIFQPYYLEWDRVEWYSVYPIDQGIADKYTLDHRVFMGGDVCHTHSPKAGQGMNTAFHDAINMAWKIHLVESDFADRSILETYEEERKFIAETLLNFDAQYVKLFSTRLPSASEVAQGTRNRSNGHGGKNEFVEMFKANCEFTSGYGVAYNPNIFNWDERHPAQSPLFKPKGCKLRTGRIMIPSNVTRVCDANVVHLENEIPMNGSFRFFIFGGNATSRSYQALTDLAYGLLKKGSFYESFSGMYRRSEAEVHDDMDNPHSRFFTVALILASKRADIEIGNLPSFYQDYRTHVYADDLPDLKVPGAKAAAHEKMGLNDGGIVVTRPDGHVGCVIALEEGNRTVSALESYFTAFVTTPRRAERPNGSGLGGAIEDVRAKL